MLSREGRVAAAAPAKKGGVAGAARARHFDISSSACKGKKSFLPRKAASRKRRAPGCCPGAGDGEPAPGVKNSLQPVAALEAELAAGTASFLFLEARQTWETGGGGGGGGGDSKPAAVPPSMSSGGGRTGARVAVKMEVAPYYGEEGLELLPDFVQLPGFGGGPGAGGPTGLEPPEESGAVQQRKLLLAGKPPPPPPPRDLGAASPGNATLPPAGPFLRPRGGTSSVVHRLIQETAVGGGGPEVGPAVLQPLLKLPAAADLEQLLIQAGSPGLAGPSSPTGGGHSVVAAAVVSGAPFLYRSPQSSAPQQAVTQEQEGFADGFVKALADLHKQNQLLGVSPAPLSPTQHPGGPCCPSSRQDPPAVYTTLGNFNPASPSAAGAFFAPQPVARLPAPGSTGRALEEPQTVPEAPVVSAPPPPPPPLPLSGLSSGESPPPPSSLSPLDAESQERLKAERKRLRNRIAASKCRRRKLERIARLEEKVKALKGQNAELAATASLLRAQVTQLQGRVRSHLSSGCHINAAPAAPAQTLAVGGQPPGREAPTEPETSAC